MTASKAGVARGLVFLVPLALIALPMAAVQHLALRFGWRLGHRLPMAFHRMALWVLGVRVAVTGAPAAGRPLLIAANHGSWLDILVFGSLMPLSFIAKSEVADWPVIGTLARLQRTVFIQRERRTKTGEQAKAIAARLSNGDAMLLFPEGTTSDGNVVLPFRSALLGAAGAAMDGDSHHEVLVQPVAIAYLRLHGLPLGRTWRPLVAWVGDQDLAGHFLTILAEGAVDVRVVFGEPIPFRADGDRKRVAITAEQAVRQLLSTALAEG